MVVERAELTSINLRHLRQRQPQLVPIQHRLALLHRVTFKVDFLQLLLVAQRTLDFAEICDLAIAGPDVLESFELFNTLERADGVGLEVEDLEFCVLRERREGGNFVVGDVEFCELGQGFDS